MPLMVGNIVLLNSGSPPMTVKAITHAGQVLCQWIELWGRSARDGICARNVVGRASSPAAKQAGPTPKNPTKPSSRRLSLDGADIRADSLAVGLVRAGLEPPVPSLRGQPRRHCGAAFGSPQLF